MTSDRPGVAGQDRDLKQLFDLSAGRLDAAAQDRLLQVAQDAPLHAVFDDSAAQLDDVTRARLQRAMAQMVEREAKTPVRGKRWLRATLALAAAMAAVLAVRASWQTDASIDPAVHRPMRAAAAAAALAKTAAAPAEVAMADASEVHLVLAESNATSAALGLVALHGEDDELLDGLALLEL